MTPWLVIPFGLSTNKIPLGTTNSEADDTSQLSCLYAGDVQKELIDWYRVNSRDLPWRRPGFSPWGALVSEFMLQQTPVARVIPALDAWLTKWPTPQDLAQSSVGDALRQWGNLGYPRRAKWLHECAVVITRDFAGEVPADVADLLSLPGVGPYTARAVAVFTFGAHEPVVDTNIRRVIARAVHGHADQGKPQTSQDMADMLDLLPGPDLSPTFNIAMMELGSLVCTSSNPNCAQCPISDECVWRLAGYPDNVANTKLKQKKYEGSNRQVRGAIMALLRDSEGALHRDDLAACWPEPHAFTKALDELVSDGLVVHQATDCFGLP